MPRVETRGAYSKSGAAEGQESCWGHEKDRHKCPEGSHQDFRSLQAKFQASQPETGDLPKKPPKPEFQKLLKKFPQPELGEHPKKPPQPEFTDLPKKPPKLEFSELSKKFLQPEATPLPRKPEVPEAPSQKPPQQPELSNTPRPPVEPKFSTPHKKPPQPEFCGLPRKPPQPQVGGLPKKPLLQPESSEVPPVPLSKPESGEPHPHSSQPDFSTFPRKIARPQLNDLPKKPLPPEFGDLTRTSSEPEVSVVPKKPRQCEFKVLSKKPPQPEPTSLSRTSSEPEFSVFPSKFLQPESRGPPRKLSQPEPGSLPRNLPRKPLLPGSFSESSLPSAVAGSNPRVPLSPGFGARQQRSGALARSAGSRLGLRPGHLPRRRPLPPASSLGPPPAKPPLPPGPRDIQSFRRAAAADTALPRTSSSAGLYLIPQDPDEVYDDVEPTDHSGPGPRSRDEALSAQQYPWRPPQNPELRKEKVPLQPPQVPPTDLKSLKQLRKAEKAEREFRKKFKFEGEIVVQTRMMIDPNAKTRRGGGKHLGIRRGEILEVIEFTSKEEMLCRDTKGKYGYVPRTALLPLETEVYDDVAAWDPLDSQPLP